jgi:hypothetical protein
LDQIQASKHPGGLQDGAANGWRKLLSVARGGAMSCTARRNRPAGAARRPWKLRFLPVPTPNNPPSALQEKTMREDTEIRIPQDDERIDVTDLKEVDYWTQWFGVSEARLRTAVASAGTVKDDLRIYLGLP